MHETFRSRCGERKISARQSPSSPSTESFARGMHHRHAFIYPPWQPSKRKRVDRVSLFEFKSLSALSNVVQSISGSCRCRSSRS